MKVAVITYDKPDEEKLCLVVPNVIEGLIADKAQVLQFRIKSKSYIAVVNTTTPSMKTVSLEAIDADDDESMWELLNELKDKFLWELSLKEMNELGIKLFSFESFINGALEANKND